MALLLLIPKRNQLLCLTKFSANSMVEVVCDVGLMFQTLLSPCLRVGMHWCRAANGFVAGHSGPIFGPRVEEKWI